jgi:hypothetical protein
MPDFRPIIRDAYVEILAREADPAGLAHYGGRMNEGLSEAGMRESLLRSEEYALKNPFNPLASRVGLNVHVPSSASLDDIALNLGIRFVRVDFNWFQIEPRRGELLWQETDRVVTHAENLGVEILGTIAYTPAWASSNPGNPRISDPPASVALWTDFVRAVTARYRERVAHWQFWNEPNLTEFWNGSMEQYRTMILDSGVRAKAEADPFARVVAPGLANVGGWRDWFNDAMRSKNLIDVINHHNYPSNGRAAIVELRTDGLFRPSLRTLMEEQGVDDRPFWLTETGRKTSDGNQPQYYSEALTTLRQEEWVSRLYFFHYWDGPDQGNAGFGIVNEDFTPKPVYEVLRSAVHPSAGALR